MLFVSNGPVGYMLGFGWVAARMNLDVSCRRAFQCRGDPCAPAHLANQFVGYLFCEAKFRKDEDPLGILANTESTFNFFS